MANYGRRMLKRSLIERLTLIAEKLYVNEDNELVFINKNGEEIILDNVINEEEE